ncbi:MAG TPA: GNAT family N-acetyltransferase [Actinomycetes bacterium]|jgi:ribosomal protein S18 acetylase RimI-like enzyme|nr:GNAT family N-acetyltransferase [Actinomycetes bacterium]
MRRSNARAGSSDAQPRAPRLSRGTRNFDDFTVRDAAVQDVEPVATLLREVYVGEGLIRADRAPTIDGVRLQVAVGGLLVAEELSTPTLLGTVALVTARNPFAELANPVRGEISALAVRAAARGRGVARALLQECMRRSADMGLDEAVLTTAPQMEEAQLLYRRMGFRRRRDLDFTVDRSPRMAYAVALYELARRQM